MSKHHMPINYSQEFFPGSIKTAMKDVGATSRDLWNVPVTDLHVKPGFNVRIKDESYYAHVRTIADSMKSEGYYQSHPLCGYVAKENDKQVIYITDGHCRFEAIQLANSEGAEIERVPVVVSQAGINLEDLTVALVRSNTGKPLSPMEVAIVCKRLIGYGMDVKTIGRRLGITDQYVNNLLILIAAPIDVRKMVTDGHVAATTAIETLQKYGDKAMEVLGKAHDHAQKNGKSRVTKKDITPELTLNRYIKKSAPALYETVLSIQSDPSYKKLSTDIREKLESVLAQISSADIPKTKH